MLARTLSRGPAPLKPNVWLSIRDVVDWLMTDAIRQYVERKEARKALLEELRAAHEEYQRTGLHLTREEVEEWMARRARGERAPMPEPHT